MIDSIDHNSRKIGTKKSMMIITSFVAAMKHKTVNDSIHYFKFMKVLSHRDLTFEKEALMYTDSLLQLFKSRTTRENYPAEYSKALLLKGDDLLKQKEYYPAYSNYYQGKSFLLGLGEICECARYSSRIAHISFQEENYFQAIEYWKQELKELAQCRQPDNFQLEFIEKQGSIRNIGIAYLHLGQPGLALKHFREASEFISSNASKFPREYKFMKFARLVIRRNQAEAYAMQGKTMTAEKLVMKCLQHDDDIEWSIDVERESRQILTKLYIDTRQFSKAEQQLKLLQGLPGMANDADNTFKNRQMQAAIWYGQGKFEAAGKLMLANQKAEQLRKLKKNAENRGNVGQLLQQIQREREKDLDAEKIARRDLILRFSILLLITLCIIVYQIWRSARKSMHNLRAVTQLNNAITQSNIALQDTVNALEQSEMENEHVLRVVAHDLRSPIASMISASQVIFMDEPPTRDQEEIINAMQNSGHKANALIGQILLSPSERNKLNKMEVSLNEIVQSCIDMLSYKAGEKQQILEYQLDKVTVPLDREKIWRVVCNVLSNSIKFTPPGGFIQINLQKQAGHVLLTVKDNGIGIPDNLKKEIFLPANKARRSGTDGEQSFGIGLSICKQIVEAHGGKIWFESVKDAGTTFYIELEYL